MVSAFISPGARFRQSLSVGCIAIPGVFNSLSAGMAGLPDVGLITQTEFADQARYLTQAVTVPVISDADTGFGEALAVERTVELFEQAGLAGLHLEDQDLPKRCGHLSGKSLISQ